jgi:hypothetical protein
MIYLPIGKLNHNMKKGTQSDVALFAMSKTEQTLADKCIGMFQDGAYGANFGMSIYALRNKKITTRRPTDFEIAIHRSGLFFGQNTGGIEPLFSEPYFMKRVKPSSKEIAVDRIAKENPGIFDEMLRKMKEAGDKNSPESLGNQPEEK